MREYFRVVLGYNHTTPSANESCEEYIYEIHQKGYRTAYCLRI